MKLLWQGTLFAQSLQAHAESSLDRMLKNEVFSQRGGRLKRPRIEKVKSDYPTKKTSLNNKKDLIKISLSFFLAICSFHMKAQAAAPQCPLKPAFTDVFTSVDALATALLPYTMEAKCGESAKMAKSLRTELANAAAEIRRYETDRYNRAAIANNKPQIAVNPYDYQKLMTNVSRVGEIALNFDCMDSVEARFPLFAALTNTINVLSPYLTIYGGPNGGAVVGINSLASVLGKVVIEVMRSNEPRKMNLTKERNIFLDSSCSFLQFSRTVGLIGAIPQTLKETKNKLDLLEAQLGQLEQNPQNPSHQAFQELSQRLANIETTSRKLSDIDKILKTTYPNAETVESSDYTKALTAECLLTQEISQETSNSRPKETKGQQFNHAGKLLSKWYLEMEKLENTNRIQKSVLAGAWSNILALKGEAIARKNNITSGSSIKALNDCGLDFRNWRENYLLLGAVVSKQFGSIGYLSSAGPEQKKYNDAILKKRAEIKEAKALIDQLKIYVVANSTSASTDAYYSAVSEVNLALTQFKDSLFKSVDGLFWGHIGKVYSPAERFLSLKIGDALDRLNENDLNLPKINTAVTYLTGLVDQSVDFENENDDETYHRESACHTLRTAKENLKVTAAHLNSFGLYCGTFKNIVTDDSKYKEYQQLCFPDATKTIKLTTETTSINDVRTRYTSNRSEEKISQYQTLIDHAVCRSAKPEHKE
jgi:hypothetical protein